MAKNGSGSPATISRRSILKSLGAGAAAAALVPNILIAEEAGKGKAVTVGKGANTYEWINWGTLPENYKFGNTHGVQVDSAGRVFIHSQGAVPDSVVIFDADGKYIKSWGKEYTGGAHGLQLVKEGNQEFLYLAATSQKIVLKTTLDGEVVWKLEFPKECDAYEGKPAGYTPTNVAVAKNGDVYIADGYGKSFIHQYDKSAKYIRSWGGAGTEPGKMRCPHGIWIDTRSGAEEIVVADRSNVRLQYFSMDGKHLRLVTKELRHPCHFDEYKGELLVPDLHGRVTLFDKNNELIVHLGDNADPKKRAGNGVPKDQWVDGQFIAPHGACYDKDGNIYVAEWVKPGRVTKLKKVGA
jgi:hypothetical protein